MENYREILKSEFQARKSRNQYYSLRAFAQSLDMGSGSLSEILNGKRNLGRNKAQAIVDKLNLSPEEKESFLDSTKKSIDSVQTPNLREKRELSIQIFEIVSSPDCLAILASADLDDFRLDVEWMSLKLGIKEKQIDYALKLMRSVGLLETINGVEKICDDFVLSPDGIPSRAIKNYHHQMLDKASTALEEELLDHRDISGISFAMDRHDVSQIKKDIANFQNKLIKKYSGKNKKNEVYHLETALFPLTKREL